METTQSASVNRIAEPKNAVLLELGGSHTECLHTQIHFLAEAGYRVYMICDAVVWSQIEEKDRLAGSMILDVKRGFFARLAMAVKIHRYMYKHEISYMVVNTTENTIVRNIFLLPFFRKVNCTCLIHNGRKFISSLSLRLIILRKVKKFFVLGEFIKQTITSAVARRSYRLEVFYPMYFPKMNDVSTIEKNDDDFWITIPGNVESSRRDYLNLLKALKQEALHPSIKIILLGKCIPELDPEIRKMIDETGLEGKQLITFGREFISNDLFHSYIRRTDLILPLLYPASNNQPAFYGNYRISGAYNLSFAYKIPMLMECSMSDCNDFQGCSFFYNTNDIISTINAFVNRKQELDDMHRNMTSNPRWNLDDQKQKYINFIELE